MNRNQGRGNVKNENETDYVSSIGWTQKMDYFVPFSFSGGEIVEPRMSLVFQIREGIKKKWKKIQKWK
jgi:hypothetical protein